jgi:hypothetical protein
MQPPTPSTGKLRFCLNGWIFAHAAGCGFWEMVWKKFHAEGKFPPDASLAEKGRIALEHIIEIYLFMMRRERALKNRMKPKAVALLLALLSLLLGKLVRQAPSLLPVDEGITATPLEITPTIQSNAPNTQG